MVTVPPIFPRYRSLSVKFSELALTVGGELPPPPACTVAAPSNDRQRLIPRAMRAFILMAFLQGFSLFLRIPFRRRHDPTRQKTQTQQSLAQKRQRERWSWNELLSGLTVSYCCKAVSIFGLRHGHYKRAFQRIKKLFGNKMETQ
jgi:hypothetical protein